MPINGVGSLSHFPVVQLPTVNRTSERVDGNSRANNELKQNELVPTTIPTSNHTVVDVVATQVVPSSRAVPEIQPQPGNTTNQQTTRDQSVIPQGSAGQLIASEPENIVITEQQQQLLQRFQQASLPVDNTSRLIDERV
ncbi:hypothetical protein [Spartinivicinus ruber]|uniref:hypothetical protein n=1 Tax=Spartinivicinus ruber TaxID=2683272 RepID=UPI0013D865F7|nr:hypothetical protein [Spartinivicinus ruber]